MLLPHNQITLEQVNKYIQNNKDCCVVNPCGSGKTMVMAEIIKEHIDKTFVIFTKQRNAANYYKEKDDVFKQRNIKIVTYTKMNSDCKKDDITDYQCDFYLIDEAQYLGASKWTEAFNRLYSTYKPRCIGFTATPQRYEQQGTANTIVEEFFGGNYAGKFTQKELQKEGVFIEPEYVLSLYDFDNTINDYLNKIDESDLSDYKKKELSTKLTATLKTWQKEDAPDIVIKNILPSFMYKKYSNRILVYVPSMAEMEIRKQYITNIIETVFPNQNIKTYTYTYRDNESELKDFLKEEDTIYIKILFSIDKITETIHIDDLSTIIMLRPSVSNRIIIQQFGRINNAGNTNKSLIIDMVNNLSSLHNIEKVYIEQKNKKEAKPKDKSDKTFLSSNINFRYVSKYQNVFDGIDGLLRSRFCYKYNNFIGTIPQICTITKRDTDAVKKVMKETGLSVQDIIDENLVPMKKISGTEFKRLDTDPLPKLKTLTEEDKKAIEDNMHIFNNFCESRKIQDDEIVSNLMMWYMYIIHNYMNDSTILPLYRYVTQNLLRAYMTYLRYQFIRNIIVKNDIDDLVEIEDTDESELITNEDDDMIEQLIHQYSFKTINDILHARLTEREYKCLSLYYGVEDGKPKTLDEVGRKFNVTRERIRQILNKGIRKLRTPRIKKKLQIFLPSNDFIPVSRVKLNNGLQGNRLDLKERKHQQYLACEVSAKIAIDYSIKKEFDGSEYWISIAKPYIYNIKYKQYGNYSSAHGKKDREQIHNEAMKLLSKVKHKISNLQCYHDVKVDDIAIYGFKYCFCDIPKNIAIDIPEYFNMVGEDIRYELKEKAKEDLPIKFFRLQITEEIQGCVSKYCYLTSAGFNVEHAYNVLINTKVPRNLLPNHPIVYFEELTEEGLSSIGDNVYNDLKYKDGKPYIKWRTI